MMTWLGGGGRGGCSVALLVAASSQQQATTIELEISRRIYGGLLAARRESSGN
jgi:mevalonate kinase